MTFPLGLPATGYLFTWSSHSTLPAWDELPEVAVQPGKRNGWAELTLATSRQLAEIGEPLSDGKYLYHFLLRTSGPRYLLLSSQLVLVEALLDRFSLRERIVRPVVAISKLVEDLVREPREYVLGAIYAEIGGFGENLRKISLFGNDIGGTELFASILPRLQPYRVSIRDVALRREVLSVGRDGEVSFHYSGAASLQHAVTFLSVLTRDNYVAWPHESGQEPLQS